MVVYGSLVVYTMIAIIMSAGTDEEAVIRLLVKHNNYQRQEIAYAYKRVYGKVNCVREKACVRKAGKVTFFITQSTDQDRTGA